MRKYLEKIIKSEKPEDMKCLEDMFLDLLCELKEIDNEKYHKFKTKIIGMAYNYTLDSELAHDIVDSMRPHGEVWSIETVRSLTNSQSFDTYVVMNSLANDYSDIISVEEVDTYVKLTDAWINDIDAEENKTWWYFVR